MNKKLAWLIFLAVIGALLFSTSTVMVTWLKLSFTPSGQLTVRAVIALVGTTAVMLFDERKKEKKFDFKSMKKYDKRLAIPVFLFRAAFNFCFIMAVTPATATIALMVLLFVKMITNVTIDSFKDKKIPDSVDLVGYCLVLAGIITYGWGATDLVVNELLVWAVASGVLEAVRLEFIGRLKIENVDKPKFAVIEFLGMLVVVGGFLILSGQGFLLPGITTIATLTYYGMIFAVLAVVINAIDYKLSNSPALSKGAYSAILATEVGFAGVLNYLLLNSPFGPQQKIALLISLVAIVVIGVSSVIKEFKKKKIAAEAKALEDLPKIS